MFDVQILNFFLFFFSPSDASFAFELIRLTVQKISIKLPLHFTMSENDRRKISRKVLNDWFILIFTIYQSTASLSMFMSNKFTSNGVLSNR